MVATSDVLLVTKPLSPPWDDSGKVLPYLVAKHSPSIRAMVLTPKGMPLDLPHVQSTELYRGPSSYRLPWSDKARLLSFLMRNETPPVVHFFFSPGSVAILGARLFQRIRPRVRTIQTVMSLPDTASELASSVFADVLVTWSALGARLANEAVSIRGLHTRIVHIAPGIEPLSPMPDEEKRCVRESFRLPQDRSLVLYAGDLEFSSAAITVAKAADAIIESSSAALVFACRPKTRAALIVKRDLQQMLAKRIDRGEVFILGEVKRFHDILRACDCQVMPVDSTWAKTDIPLVLLEGLSAGVPAIVATGTAMDELVEKGAVIGVSPNDPKGLAEAVFGLLRHRGLKEALGARGRAWVLSQHTAEAMAAAHVRLYTDMLYGRI